MSTQSLKKQFRALKMMASQLKHNYNPNGDLEAFGTCVAELKAAIQAHTKDRKVIRQMDKIPELKFRLGRPRIFQSLVSTIKGSYVDSGHKEIIDEALNIAAQYAAIEDLIK